MKLWVKILTCMLSIVLLGGLGAVVTTPAIPGWYSALEKPPGVPPNTVFGPVWTALYSMMGISLALIWHRVEPGLQKKQAFGLFLAQLILNLAWSPVFFGLHWMGVALIIIIALLLLLPCAIIKIRSADKLAGRLLIPYAIWVGYATYLNAGYWWLNR
jgi:tryptophan-rich sensory protein